MGVGEMDMATRAATPGFADEAGKGYKPARIDLLHGHLMRVVCEHGVSLGSLA